MNIFEVYIPGRPDSRRFFRADANLSAGEVLRRHGLGDRWRVVRWPEGRPDQAETIQEGRNP